jgi:P27 family predicted phage terminase small subunit
LVAKRLEILRELVPRAARVAVLVNPTSAATAEAALKDAAAAARAMRLQIEVFNAGTPQEIDAAFETLPVAPTRRNRRRPAPDHLSTDSKAWWAEVTGAFDLDSHHLRLLQLCCESLDRVAEAHAILAVEGLMFTDQAGNPRAHPATIIERDNKIATGRLIKELHLDPPPDNAPGGIGWMPPTVPRPWDR